ncbi:AAA family ATPase [Solibaculum mannosilyticum]|uniref:AAA family ATPase n=1 Tax=Solibaculum mannosilyticum TaxID=2780922 RepID=UPI0034C511FE
MRPLKIVMQAFGPYLNRCEVDFSRLGKSKLFLIAGPTGSGKTTILDAMSFALYGESTGSLRKWKEMRHTAAPQSVPTLTEVEFSLGQEAYRFARSYSQRTVKKRAGGTELKIETEASCYHWQKGHWKLMDSGPRVSAIAKELLGFTHDQFSQVIVLPQGEFRKLLVASSTEKESILETLFATGRWKQVTAAVVAAADQLKRQLTAASEERQNLLRLEQVDCFDALKQKLLEQETAFSEKKKQSLLLEQELSAAQEALRQGLALHEQYERLSTAKERLLSMENNRSSIEEMRVRLEHARRAASLHPYWSACQSAQSIYQQKKSDLEAAIRSLKEAEEEYQSAGEKAKQLPSFQERAEAESGRIALLTRSVEQCQRLENARQNRASLQSQVTVLHSQQQSLAEECSQLDARLQKAQQFLQEQFDQIISRIPLLTAQVQELQTAVKERDAVKRLEQEVIKAQYAYGMAGQEVEDAHIASVAADNAYLLMEKAAQADAAYWLASSLLPDEPCPVCGSTSHPALAVPADGVPAPQQLEACRAAKQQAAEAFQRAESKLQQKKIVLENAQSQWQEANEIFSRRGIDARTLNATLERTQCQLDNAQAEEQKRPGYEKARDKIQAKLQLRSADLDRCRQEVSQAEQRLAAAIAAQEELSQSLSGAKGNASDYQKQLLAAKHLHESLKKQIESIQTALQEARVEHTKSLQAHAAAQKALEESISHFEQCRREWETQCLSLGVAPDEKHHDFYLPKEEMESLEQRILQFDRSYDLTKSQTKDLEQQLDGSSPPDLDALRTRQQEAQLQKSQSDTELGSLQARTASLKRTCGQLDDCIKRTAELEQQYTRTGGLGQLLSGKNPLKTPIHQFVLGVLLDDVVRTANLYFIRLSRGQYSLIRQDSQGGQGFRGLDLYVNDAHRGGTRSVKTLSGGELFLASLSLAFGLSDVVQSMAGGVHLDAIFIDEGFGTLDMETLEAAMRALDDIQASGRLVGIISHVRELRDRISMRIEVSPDPHGGSSLQWKNDV